MRITKIDTHVLLDPDFDTTAASSSQDDFVVEIHTDEGLSGFGEADINPWIAAACVTAPGTHNMGLGLEEMLIGLNPLDVENIWQRLYTGSAMNGRTGAVMAALGALDIALHDIRGQATEQPCYQHLGPAARKSITPYASLQPEVSSFEDYRDSLVEWALKAKANGFRALKSEVTLAGPYAHNDLREPWERSTEVIAAVRSAIGPDIDLLVDVQYAFPDADVALRVLREWEEFDLAFVEAPLWPEDLIGYSRLCAEQSIPIASGEWLTSRHEVASLMDDGHVPIIQPDIGRIGGLTPAVGVAADARAKDRRIVPHVWKTGISIAAAAHFAATTDRCDYIEFLPAELSESALRKNLTSEDIQMVNGYLQLPTQPGLGITVDRDALAYYSEAANSHGRARPSM